MAGDVNGDGKLDVVLDYVGYSNTNGASEVTESGILTVPGIGDGTFTPGISTSLPTTSQSGESINGEYIGSMVLLDYSGSGHAGLMYTNGSGLLQAMPGNGDGTFGAPNASVSLPSNLYAWQLIAANMKNSGRTDLIIVSDDSIGILLNTGSDGTLGTPIFYPAFETDNVAAADWNGDGKKQTS